jgi:uncharacterized protein (DUF4415 family)
VVVIVHTETAEVIRIISVRKATKMKNSTTTRKSQTDWTRLETMGNDDIDTSDSPEIAPELFAKVVVRQGLKPVSRKSQLTLRLDSDVLTWFKSQGRGYQTRINTLLRAYMNAHREQSKNVRVSSRKG